MKILYGIVGVGLGHATRSATIINHLKKRHEIRIVTSGEAYPFLQGIVPIIYRVHGMQLVCKNNTLKNGQTFFKNLLHFPFFLSTIVKGITIFFNYKPDYVLCDFDSLTGYLGKLFRVPIISVDNIHITTMGEIKTQPKRLTNTLITRLKTPFSNQYLIPSFFTVPLKDKLAKLFPPLVRDEVFTTTTQGNHILIYQKPESIPDILSVLFQFPNQKFIVYGYGKNKREKNVEFKRTAKKRFIQDLASAKAVITRAGLSMISEALVLHKPLLCIPLQGQYEQETNATYVEALGYGMKAKKLAQESLATFLTNLPGYQHKVNTYSSQNNKELLAHLDKLLTHA